MGEVTAILTAMRNGEGDAAERLFALVYEELRTLAAAKMARERPGQTLQATALVSEAYLRLMSRDDVHWESRGHFFGSAAEAMRRILIDAARKKAAEKRKGGDRVSLDAVIGDIGVTDDEFLVLDEAITGLEGVDAQAAAIVKLRAFAGLSADEAAEALGVSRRTVFRDWDFAKAWLLRAVRS